MTRIHPMATRSRFRKAGIALSAALVLGGAFSGCTRIKDHEGFIIEDALVAQIQPGVDNKESVEAMLGKPSFTGMFGGNEYYYVSRDLRHIAFGTPKPSDQKIIKVTFNAAGGVSSIEQIGVDQVASISPNGDVTPSMGSNMGFFESIFDNMGAPGGSGTAEGSGDPTNR